MEKLIDLTHIIEEDMPNYPGDIKTSLFQTKYLSENKHNNHRLEISMHSGTHIDAPMHLTERRIYISDLPLNSFVAKGCLLDVRNEKVIHMKEEYKQLVEENSIVLLYTGLSRIYGTQEYYQKNPTVDMELGKFLLSKNIKILGMDMPSPDRYPFEIHKLLLNNDIYIMENLTNLDKLLELKSFEVIALPMNIKADGSMTRVIARGI